MFQIGSIMGSLILDDRFTKPLMRAQQQAAKSGQLFGKSMGQMEQRSKRLNDLLARAKFGTGRFDKLAAELRRTDKALAEMRKTAQGTAKATMSVADAMNGIVRSAAALATGRAIKGLSDMGASFEQATISFTTFLGGSKEAADAMLDSLNELSNVTPFTNNQIIKAGKVMLAFGADAASIIPTLRTIGDISAATGKNFNELAIIYGQAMTEGLVMGETLKQLTESGIPIIKVFAKQFKVAESQIKKMGSEGKITFKSLEKAFQSMSGKGGRFFNLMEKQSRSFTGMLSTLEGVLGLIGTEIGLVINSLLKPALKFLIGAAKSLLAWMKDLDPAIKSVGIAVTLLAVAIAIIVPLWKLMVFGVNALNVSLLALLTNPVVLLLGSLVIVAALVVAAVIKMHREWDKFVDFLEPAIKAFSALKNAIAGVATIIGKFAMKFAIVRALKDDFGRLMEAIGGAKADFKKFTEGVDIFATAIKAAIFPIVAAIAIVSGVVRVLFTLIEGVVAASKQMGQVLIEMAKASAAIIGGPAGILAWSLKGGATRMRKAWTDLGEAMTEPWKDAGKIIRETGKILIRTAKDIITRAEEEREKLKPAITLPSLDAGAVGKARKSLQAQFDKLGEGLDFSGASERIAKQFAATLFNDLATAVDIKAAIGFVKAMGDIGGKIASTFAKSVQDGLKIAQNHLQRTMGEFGLIADLALADFKRRKDEELALFIEVEDAKIAALRAASFERLAIVDEEFARRKAALAEELRQTLANLEIERIARVQFVTDEAARQSDRVLDTGIVNQNALDLIEEAKTDHENRLRELENETQTNKREEEQATAVALEKAELQKTETVEEFNKRREEEDKRNAKVRTAIEYGFSLAAFAIGQQQAVSAIRFSLAQSIIGAVQAGINLTAATAGFGFAQGAALTGALTTLATAAAGSALGVVASTPPPLPPAEVFARGGGVIGGLSHANGGTAVRAERGEAILDRGLTDRLDASLDRPPVVIHFGAGAIIVHGNMDSDSIDILAEAVAKKVEQRRF